MVLAEFVWRLGFFIHLEARFVWTMAANRESSVEESSEWAGISESGDDDMDFEVWSFFPSQRWSFGFACRRVRCAFMDRWLISLEL